MVFVFFSTSASPVGRAESQQQAIALESGSEPELPEDDSLITGLLPGLIVNEFQSLSAILPETLSPTGSDAYPSITLHGPPAPGYPA